MVIVTPTLRHYFARLLAGIIHAKRIEAEEGAIIRGGMETDSVGAESGRFTKVFTDYIHITENREETGFWLDYYPDIDAVALVVDGIKRLIIKRNGRIEIDAALDVRGDSHLVDALVDNRLMVMNWDGRFITLFFGRFNDIEFKGPGLVLHPPFTSGYDARAVLFLKGDVNDFRVGVGTDNPQAKMHVAGDVRIDGRLGTNGYPPDSGYPEGWNGGIHTWDVYAEGSIGVGQGGDLKAVLRSDGLAWILGKLGIGTQNPGYPLEVSGDVKLSGRLGTNGFPPDSGYPEGWAGGIHTWDIYAEGSIGLGHNGELKAAMNSGGDAWFLGKLGVGTNAPQARLHVAGDAKVDGVVNAGGVNAGDSKFSKIYTDYVEITEAGQSKGFILDYFPHKDGVGFLIDGKPKFIVTRPGYAITPRLYISEEGSEDTERFVIDYAPSPDRLEVLWVYGGVWEPKLKIYADGGLEPRFLRGHPVITKDNLNNIVFGSYQRALAAGVYTEVYTANGRGVSHVCITCYSRVRMGIKLEVDGVARETWYSGPEGHHNMSLSFTIYHESRAQISINPYDSTDCVVIYHRLEL